MPRGPLLLVPLVLAAGCRSACTAPPTEEERAAFGDVAVVLAPGVKAGLPAPVSGWPAGLAFGTLRGIGAVPVFAFYGGGAASSGGGGEENLGVLLGVVVGAAVGVLYIPVSVGSGTFTAADPEEVARAEAVLLPILGDPSLPRSFADRFRAEAGRTFVSREEAETVVELRVESVTGGADWDLFTVERPFEIRVSASARVVRASDGLVIWEAVRESRAPVDEEDRRTYVGWAESGGASLRAEIEGALSRLAHGFAWSIFAQDEGDPLPAEAR